MQRDLLDTLRRREPSAVGGRLSAVPYLQPATGGQVAGTYRQSLTLTSGRFAMIDTGPGFQLVPWSPPLESLAAVSNGGSGAPAREDAAVRRLMTIPGIGTINATALAAAVGDARTFGRGATWQRGWGLTPRQRTTGGKPRLPGISKRGNRYLRKNLIHGAPAVLPRLADQDTPLGRWTRALLARAEERRDRRAGQQAGTHRLGGARPRPRLRRALRAGMTI